MTRTGCHIVAMDATFRRRYWASLGPPIRPSPASLAKVFSLLGTPKRVLLLGATVEYLNGIAELGCEEAVVVDNDPVSLEVMLAECVVRDTLRLTPVVAEWSAWLGGRDKQYDCVLMDCGFLFTHPPRYGPLVDSIARVLSSRRGVFVSRQLVRGSVEHCRHAWLASLQSLPGRDGLSVMLLTNVIIAAAYGAHSVSYRRLQRLGRHLLRRLSTVDKNGDASAIAQMIEAFLALDVKSASFEPPMKRLLDRNELVSLLQKAFSTVEAENIAETPEGYYTVLRAIV